jgi:hypothetical protein
LPRLKVLSFNLSTIDAVPGTLTINRRYQHKSTVVTTNKPFAEWGEVFPNAACVVSLIDRLMHRAEVVRIEGKSYRQKEADEREVARKAERAARKPSPRPRKVTP